MLSLLDSFIDYLIRGRFIHFVELANLLFRIDASRLQMISLGLVWVEELCILYRNE